MFPHLLHCLDVFLGSINSKYIIDSKTGDGRRYVGENVILLKDIDIYDEVED